MLRLILSCDHRVVDGALGAELLATVKRLIESPVTMLV
jgi:pyruvate dehydrogenase E2 component (dihydrolipoamide acetyltransferase)